MTRSPSTKTFSEISKYHEFDHPDPIYMHHDLDDYFMSVKGNQLKKFLGRLHDDKHIKFLKDGSKDRTVNAINAISDNINYGLGFEIGTDVFLNDPSSIKDKVKSLQYYQRSKNPKNRRS